MSFKELHESNTLDAHISTAVDIAEMVEEVVGEAEAKFFLRCLRNGRLGLGDIQEGLLEALRRGPIVWTDAYGVAVLAPWVKQALLEVKDAPEARTVGLRPILVRLEEELWDRRSRRQPGQVAA